jgi:hypothetical protein
MYRTIKAELKVCPPPKPINEFAEALAAAARADAGEEGANKAVDTFEQTAEASAARKLKMTENLAKRVKKRREDRLALWADDGDHDDDEEECAANRLAVVLEEVKGRGADFRHLREVRLVDCLITDEKLSVLVESLGQGCVSVLALGGNQITNIGARTLGEALAALAPLRELHLNGNCIADPGVEALCKGLFGHLTAAEKKRKSQKSQKTPTHGLGQSQKIECQGEIEFVDAATQTEATTALAAGRARSL